jgi:DNA repair exonuclease SbcCD nuclease subunit
MPTVALITDQHICRASRWEETLRLMRWFVAKMKELKPDVIAFGGDLFDRAITVDELRIVGEWLVELAEIAALVAIRGNHCVEGLTVFNLLESKHRIHFTDRPETFFAGGVTFVLLPWPRKAHLLAMLGDAGKEESRQAGIDLLLNVLRGLGQQGIPQGEFHPRCFVGHVQLRGAQVSTGQPLAPGADFELGLEDLALANCDAYLLGHIHLPDDMTMSSGAPVSYGGSFRRTAYGEVEEKSIVVLDFEQGKVMRSRIPIPCAPMLLLEGEWSLQSGLWMSGQGARQDVEGAEIRLRYTVDVDQRDAARAFADTLADDLRARGAVDVKVEEQVRSMTRARAPEIAAAVTLEDKLDAYWRARNSTPDNDRAKRLKGKVGELQLQSGKKQAS